MIGAAQVAAQEKLAVDNLALELLPACGGCVFDLGAVAFAHKRPRFGSRIGEEGFTCAGAKMPLACDPAQWYLAPTLFTEERSSGTAKAYRPGVQVGKRRSCVEWDAGKGDALRELVEDSVQLTEDKGLTRRWLMQGLLAALAAGPVRGRRAEGICHSGNRRAARPRCRMTRRCFRRASGRGLSITLMGCEYMLWKTGFEQAGPARDCAAARISGDRLQLEKGDAAAGRGGVSRDRD